MAHPVGERLRCNACGAEIIYVKACPCPDAERKAHPDVCCDEKMESLGVQSRPGEDQPIHRDPRH